MTREKYRKIINEIDHELASVVRNWLYLNFNRVPCSDMEIDSLVTTIEIKIQEAICAEKADDRNLV